MLFGKKKDASRQSVPRIPCDLCGLDVEREDFVLDTGGRRLHFCCDGCLGIYRLLNEGESGVDSAAGDPD